MKKQIVVLAIRWFANALGLWLATKFGLLSFSDNYLSLILAAIILAVLNALLKPLLILFTLPAIVFTLGLFIIIINGVIVWLLGWLYGPVKIDSFWAAVLAGIVVGLVNYIVTLGVEKLGKSHE